MPTAVVSVRVPRELKEEAERLGIDLRRVVVDALQRAVEEERARRVARALQALGQALKEVSEEEWVRTIREMRRSR